MLLLLSLLLNHLQADPFPISFSIPECKIVKEIPSKEQDFAFIIPGLMKTYIYKDEKPYYKDYQKSYFAITCRKGGWDCMRHYEILANGCIPYFLNLDACDPIIMPFLPRELIKEAMNLEGVSYLHIDHSKFDKDKYNDILKKLLDYTRLTLSTKAMAKYVLEKMNYTDGPILFLLQGYFEADYLRDVTLIGLKELLGNKLVIDFPKVEFIYKSYTGDIRGLYGKGMSYTKILRDSNINRTNIEERIRNQEFSLIIYGSIHRGTPFWDTVHECYPQEKIAYMCGEDSHTCQYFHLPNLFLREWP